MKKKILKLITETIKAVDLEMDVGVQQSGVNMSYDFIQNRVYVDLDRVVQARLEMLSPVHLREYIMTLTLHELGHALDRDALLDAMPRMIEIAKIKKEHQFINRREDLKLFAFDIEAHEMDISFEETAWDNARELNNQYGLLSLSVIEKVETHSMSSYFDFYEKDLTDYKRLIAAERMQRKTPIMSIV